MFASGCTGMSRGNAYAYLHLAGSRQKSLRRKSPGQRDKIFFVGFGSLAVMTHVLRAVVDPWLCVPGFHRVCLYRFPTELYYHKGPKYLLTINFQEGPKSRYMSLREAFFATKQSPVVRGPFVKEETASQKPLAATALEEFANTP